MTRRALILAALLALPLSADAMGGLRLGRGLGISQQEPQWTPRRLAPALWFRADLGITLNGATVSAWANQGSDAAGGLAQSTADNQPTWTASAINGRPALTFDATNDLLTSASANLAQPNFVALAFQPGNTVGVNRSIIDGAVARTLVFVGDSVAGIYAGTSAVIGAAANGSNYATQLRVAGAASASRLNAAAWTIGQNFGALALSSMCAGGNGCVGNWGGLTAEIIVLDTLPSTRNEDLLHAYMRVRYALW